jgi:hypothetical protein
MHIPRDRDDMVVVENLHAATDNVIVYSDGLVHNGHVGAAALLVRQDGTSWYLRLYLGRDTHYTVHIAEGVGLMLATHLLHMEPLVLTCASIGINNQAVILGCRQY